MEIPRFRLFGQGNPEVEHTIQPKLDLRDWDELGESDKNTALLYVRNNGWLGRYSRDILHTVEYMNKEFLRDCPGKLLHQIQPKRDYDRFSGNEHERMDAALEDFAQIFVRRPGVMVLRMLSVFASCHIENGPLRIAEQMQEAAKRKEQIDAAFEKFDRFANCLNHMFEQFAVNQLVTRAGFVPRQDDLVTAEVYVPTLAALADPRWKPVSDDLASAFEDYRNKNAPEAITKAHTAVQRFLQILVGEEGKNGKGEVGKLYQEAKQKKLIPVNRFTEPLVNVITSFIVSERATNSTAKPTLADATPSDALLVLNTVMVFLQFCLQAQ